jgi:hypothetical protein
MKVAQDGERAGPRPALSKSWEHWHETTRARLAEPALSEVEGSELASEAATGGRKPS